MDDHSTQKLTNRRARDARGNIVQVFDLVKIIRIPETFYDLYEDRQEGIEFYSKFINSFGIVCYGDSSPDGSYRWYSDGNRTFYLNAIGVKGDNIVLYDLALPYLCIERIDRDVNLYATIGVLGGKRNWISKDDYIQEELDSFDYFEYLNNLLGRR